MSTRLIQFYNPKKKRTELIPILILCPLKPRIVQIDVGKHLTTLRMAPKWFELDNSIDALKNIRYPNGISEDAEHQYDVVARYRSLSSDETNDFIAKPIELNEANTETLIVGLDNFVQQLGGELTFTSDEFTYEEATHRTACGVANLSSAHLLAANYLSTAEFHFLLDLDYSSDLARTDETMQNFILNFSDSIANLLQCPNDYVRVNSLQKPGKKRRETKINFGLTTPDQEKTEELAQQLQTYAKQGFVKHRTLRHIKPNQYDYEWKPLISYFQLQKDELAPEFNRRYGSDMNPLDRRGGYPYHLPIGWFRHALKVIYKYPHDKQWLGHANLPGEWAVAYHGTHEMAVKGIIHRGLQTGKSKPGDETRDLMRDESTNEKGSEFDRPGLYVATHCDGGAHPSYTKTFQVKGSDAMKKEYRVVFQCRVRPGAFSTHSDPVDEGHAWRFVDPEAIRPYGLLIKTESVSS